MLAIETRNLSKKYKEKYAVKNLNLTVNHGELYGLLGVNVLRYKLKVISTT